MDSILFKDGVNLPDKLIRASEGSVFLRVKVVPNSEDFEIGDVNRWRKRLKVRVSSSPSKGKANEELVEKMGEVLDRRIRIKTGAGSRKKTLEIENIEPGQVYDKLGMEEP
ncbi:MAG: DUF167 domain-containing protein [Candidatus Aenigmatarchaeota archaeon]